MDYYEARDDLDGEPEQSEPSAIQRLFEGAHVFITGASGFMGKVLMEKLLRTCNVAQIYILVRDKKGVKSEERLHSIFSDRYFEPLKLLKPSELRKVQILPGDCGIPGLGLSEAHKAALSSVSVVFHAAATLQMDQSLRIAYATNVTATHFLLEFAKTLPLLKAFMYVSTAYTHAYRDVVEETFYSIEYDENDMAQFCEQLDDTQLGSLTPKLLGRWGNTYALTKACAENLVSKYDGVLPIGVVRPSIVVSVWKEPLRGWINNLYGAVGVVTGTGLGLLRVWCAGPDMIGDMIPVDTAINMTLAATWQVACQNTHLKIYNLVSSPKNPITYSILRTSSLATRQQYNMGSTHAIAAPCLTLTANKTLFLLYTIWYHLIPGYAIDFFLQAVGKKPQLMKVYTKVYNVNKSLMPYCSEKDIVFKSDNVDRMWDLLSETDKQLFDFDLKSMSWEEFWINGIKGMRVYLLNDPMETADEGERHLTKLEWRKRIIDSLLWIIFGLILYFIVKSYFY